MKKLIYIFIFLFFLINNCSYAVLDWNKIKTSNSTNLAMLNPMDLTSSSEFEEFKQKYSTSIYETDSYKVKLNNFTQIDEQTFSDNDYPDSNITITVGEHKIPTALLSYEDIYTVDYLNELEKSITQTLENSLNITCTPSISRIDDFAYYPAFLLKYNINITNEISYHMWAFEIFSDNYVYCVLVKSPNFDYLSTSNVRTFIDSFNIKDTTNLCTPSTNSTITVQNDKPPASSTIEETTNNNFIALFIADIIFAAVFYLFIPIIIRFVLKDSFKTSIAFGISLINFLFIKILLSILFNIPFTTTTAWWYLFIGQAILTKSNSEPIDNNEEIIEPNNEVIKKF